MNPTNTEQSNFPRFSHRLPVPFPRTYTRTQYRISVELFVRRFSGIKVANLGMVIMKGFRRNREPADRKGNAMIRLMAPAETKKAVCFSIVLMARGGGEKCGSFLKLGGKLRCVAGGCSLVCSISDYSVKRLID